MKRFTREPSEIHCYRGGFERLLDVWPKPHGPLGAFTNKGPTTRPGNYQALFTESPNRSLGSGLRNPVPLHELRSGWQPFARGKFASEDCRSQLVGNLPRCRARIVRVYGIHPHKRIGSTQIP